MYFDHSLSFSPTFPRSSPAYPPNLVILSVCLSVSASVSLSLIKEKQKQQKLEIKTD